MGSPGPRERARPGDADWHHAGRGRFAAATDVAEAGVDSLGAHPELVGRDARCGGELGFRTGAAPASRPVMFHTTFAFEIVGAMASGQTVGSSGVISIVRDTMTQAGLAIAIVPWHSGVVPRGRQQRRKGYRI